MSEESECRPNRREGDRSIDAKQLAYRWSDLHTSALNDDAHGRSH